MCFEPGGSASLGSWSALGTNPSLFPMLFRAIGFSPAENEGGRMRNAESELVPSELVDQWGKPARALLGAGVGFIAIAGYKSPAPRN